MPLNWKISCQYKIKQIPFLQHEHFQLFLGLHCLNSCLEGDAGCNIFFFSGFAECSVPAALSNLVSQYNWDVLNEVDASD